LSPETSGRRTRPKLEEGKILIDYWCHGVHTHSTENKIVYPRKKKDNQIV